jgi:NAD(P)-dependent dehydrogenase (short-subunit alcohol dehydrogenase family)
MAFGTSWTTLLADVADPKAATRIASAVKRRWGALDLLLNNAGISPGGSSFATEREGDLERTLAVNVLAVHRLTRALLPLLKKGRRPRVVNVSSGAMAESMPVPLSSANPGISSRFPLPDTGSDGWVSGLLGRGSSPRAAAECSSAV